jgi:hypothetical protein
MRSRITRRTDAPEPAPSAAASRHNSEKGDSKAQGRENDEAVQIEASLAEVRVLLSSALPPPEEPPTFFELRERTEAAAAGNDGENNGRQARAKAAASYYQDVALCCVDSLWFSTQPMPSASDGRGCTATKLGVGSVQALDLTVPLTIDMLRARQRLTEEMQRAQGGPASGSHSNPTTNNTGSSEPRMQSTELWDCSLDPLPLPDPSRYLNQPPPETPPAFPFAYLLALAPGGAGDPD